MHAIVLLPIHALAYNVVTSASFSLLGSLAALSSCICTVVKPSKALQANLDPETEPEDWQLDALATKVGQYCFLLQNMTGSDLRAASDGDFEKIRTFLIEQGAAAYREKVCHVPCMNLHGDAFDPQLLPCHHLRCSQCLAHWIAFSEHMHTIAWEGGEAICSALNT